MHHEFPHPLKICVITQQLGKIFSGPGLHTYNLVNALIADGHNVCVIAPINQRPSKLLNFEFISIDQSILNGTQARWIPLSFLYWRKFRRISHKNFDLIHFTDARESLFFRTDIPCVGNINDTYAAELRSISYYQKHFTDWYIRWPYYLMARLFEKFAYSKLDVLIANSEFTAKTIHEKYRINEKKIHVCYKGIDVSKYQSAEIKERNFQNSPVILFVGTNMQRKGLPTLIHAAHIVTQKIPNVKFWIVGEDKTLPEMKKLCINEGVDNSFVFWGWKSQEELSELYSQADIFVMPSLTEALGVVFLEAMASGLPVIGTNIGGIPEIIQDGINGLLVPPDDSTALARALTKLLVDVELRKEISGNAQKMVQRFSVGRMMETTYQIYSSLLDIKKG